MANDRDSNDSSAKSSDSKKGTDRNRTIGEGMNSLDSTQVPLKSENGEPDWDAVKGDVPADVERARKNSGH